MTKLVRNLLVCTFLVLMLPLSQAAGSIEVDQYYNIRTLELIDMSEFDPNVPYEDVYRGEDLFLKGQKRGYDYIPRMCLSEASKSDMDFIREKLEIANIFSSMMAVMPFSFLFTTGRYCSQNNMFTIITTDWEEIAKAAAKVPQFIKQTMIKHLRMVLYRATVENRPRNDIKFWRSFLKAWKNS